MLANGHRIEGCHAGLDAISGCFRNGCSLSRDREDDEALGATPGLPQFVGGNEEPEGLGCDRADHPPAVGDETAAA
jgi:hypothetical protein